MTVYLPTMTSDRDDRATVIFAETTPDHLLLRTRTASHQVESPGTGRSHAESVFLRTPFTLTDVSGAQTVSIQSAEYGGPFEGALDIAFPLEDDFDLLAPLVLTAGDLKIGFQLGS